jgi:hypothetical protein
MKTFYTDHDIEDMAKAGIKEIEVHDDVVLTDLALEKALKLGIRLRQQQSKPPVAAGGRPLLRPSVATASGAPPSSPLTVASSQSSLGNPAPVTQSADASLSGDEFRRRVKSALIERLGPGVPETMIDAAIHKVLREK